LHGGVENLRGRSLGGLRRVVPAEVPAIARNK